MLKRNVLLFSALAASVALASMARAADMDVNADLDTQQAISLTKTHDMDFGSVEFSATHTGAIRLATNGNVTLAGATGLVMSGTPAAGQVSVSGDGASIIELSCETGGVLSDGTNSLTLASTEISTAGSGVAWGLGNACAGLGTPSATVNLSVTPSPSVRVGGAIDVSGNAIHSSDTYSTTEAGGNPVTLQVVYQ